MPSWMWPLVVLTDRLSRTNKQSQLNILCFFWWFFDNILFNFLFIILEYFFFLYRSTSSLHEKKYSTPIFVKIFQLDVFVSVVCDLFCRYIIDLLLVKLTFTYAETCLQIAHLNNQRANLNICLIGRPLCCVLEIFGWHRQLEIMIVNWNNVECIKYIRHLIEF